MRKDLLRIFIGAVLTLLLSNLSISVETHERSDLRLSWIGNAIASTYG
jgi:hypothetical protein